MAVMMKCLFILSLIMTRITTADLVNQREVIVDEGIDVKHDISAPVKTISNSLIEGLLNYSKKQNGSPLPPRLDMVFVLDSYRVDSKHFKYLKTIIQNLVREFSISPSTARIALIRCSIHAHLEFGLDHFVNREGTLKALKNLRYHQGSRCSLTSALDLVRLVVFRKNDLHAKKQVFVITPGKQRYDRKTTTAASKLRKSGVEVYVLYVGNDYRVSSHQGNIASRPLRTHSLRVNNYDDLMEVGHKIKGRGFDRTCHTNGTTVYDECRRRCKCSNGQMIDCYRVRKEFTSMTLEERRLYIHALKTVSTVEPYKRVYDIMTSYHPRWFKIVHKLKYFFPWHRWYILTFENFLRQVDCRVTIPYWDWSRAVSKGSLFRATWIRDVWHPGTHAIGGNGATSDRCVRTGPFSKGSWLVYLILKKNHTPSCLTREFNSCYSRSLRNAKYVNELLKLPWHKFKVFEKKVRSEMHNDFHNAVGGVMSFEESANAPEFWFHHGYLDKLWGDWQNRGARFKHQYFHEVKSNLPGTNFKGTSFIDLSRQPMSVRVVQDPPMDMEEKEEDFDRSIEEPEPVYWCNMEADD